MGFFSLLGALFAPSKPKSRRSSIEREELAELDEYDAASARRLKKVASLTFDLVEGIDDRAKERLVRTFEFSEKDELTFDDLFNFTARELKGKDWHWLEWEFWAPICLEHRLATDGMNASCRPWPDVLDMDAERAAYTVEKVVKTTTLKAFHEKLSSSFPEVLEIKRKAQMTEFLTEHNEALLAIVDPLIQEKWNKKKHNPGFTEDGLIELLCSTILARANDLEQLDEERGSGFKYAIVFGDEDKPTPSEDHQLYDIAKKTKNKPWKNRIMPNIPGLFFERDYL